VFWSNKRKKEEKEILARAEEILAETTKQLEVVESGRAPRGYVAAREPIDLDDANEILDDAVQRNSDIRFAAGLDVAYCSVPPEKATFLAMFPLQQLLMSFIQQIDGGKYLTNDYEFIQYYHPAEGTPPRANKDKEYYVLVPIRKV
jgi:hypothetical protein